ncbi:hypothetical protein ACJRO7_015294 [Eucalyptus globulus]|uniref:Uncharacterized protein n=1 Tax=Eucalyptus globulus TaxID=34317 RepID=A0ABD3L3K8_EUCGL
MAASACNRAMQRASTSLGPALKSGVRSSPQLGFASPRFPLPARSTASPPPPQPWRGPSSPDLTHCVLRSPRAQLRLAAGATHCVLRSPRAQLRLAAEVCGLDGPGSVPIGRGRT